MNRKSRENRIMKKLHKIWADSYQAGLEGRGLQWLPEVGRIALSETEEKVEQAINRTSAQLGETLGPEAREFYRFVLKHSIECYLDGMVRAEGCQ